MKKIFSIAMVAALIVSLTACAKQQNTSNTQSSNSTTASQTTQTVESKSDSESMASASDNNQTAEQTVSDLFMPATSAATGAYATVKVSPQVKFDDTTAWLGLCPAGKDYITELEADEVDVVYFYSESPETRSETDPHVFACDFSSVEDGKYALVVCTSDDADVGYVVIQLEMTKAGESITFDYSKAKLNERPVKS